MIENAIYNDPHPVAVNGINEGIKVCACAKLGIDFIIVAGVVAVIGGGKENGVEIKRIHAKIKKIIQFLNDTA